MKPEFIERWSNMHQSTCTYRWSDKLKDYHIYFGNVENQDA